MKESVLQAKLMARCRRAEANNPDFFWVYSYPAGLTLGYRRDAGGRIYSPQAIKAVQSPEEAADRAEAARNFGVVRVPITADYKPEWTGLVERAVSVLARRFEEHGLESIEVVPPDAAGLLVLRVNAVTSRMSDEQFRLWLEGAFHAGMEGQT
jgi:hypothetical protein